ncbi:DUF7847 domain-containing protein [Halobellus captivus]|uniref:DUF7847 domain-containing protein n=1 Tax=Halobellus captivus TaxID=2592614 RepID=UPI0011A322D0|nr:hypothetical protein [Halobellus captivus]
MAALKSLRPAVGALIRNPILIAIVGLFGVVQLPQLALQSSQPLLAALVSLAITGVMIIVVPFFQGGLLGMADEALDGETSVDTLLADGKANYVSLLIAYLAVFAVNLALGFVSFFVALFGGAGLFALGGQSNRLGLIVFVGIGLLFVLAYLLIAFFIQFYGHAIVLSDTDVVDGFKRSLGLVRRNPLSVLGYSALLLVGSVVFGGVGGVASILLSPQPTALPLPELSMPILAGAAVVYIVAIAVLGAFYATYSVAFYRAIDGTRAVY